ncbi:hypothetical protein SLEP1_g8832 [Rubroshorea leprosula]|uniref:Uncharacterized protein n=1 Tax=Rubroshorea leprosula TaxID=152421 RepID=A0AAV5I8K8_9ROSI|nr:hypothetical protein SLEP1_g8832 [Rubroshorea leprosula]
MPSGFQFWMKLKKESEVLVFWNPRQAGSDGGAADRIVWTGVTSLLLFLAFAVLF